MFRIGKKNQKGVAAFFLLVMTIQNFWPAAAYALTAGPSQPEMQKFQPAGADNMVDPFSGDFKYEIPLMDVGGYPINLTYHSGSGIEDEASWVGSGWSLNPGSVNRTMRGIPDDFNGKASGNNDVGDFIRSSQSQKPFNKIGGELVIKPSIFAWEIGSGSLKLGVYKDNYWGMGAELGASLSFHTDKDADATLTAGLSLTSDPRDGVTLNPSFSLTSNYEDNKELNNAELSGGFTYNSRQGLKSVNLGQSFGINGTNDDGNTGGFSATVASFDKYYGIPFTPTLGTNTTSSSTSYNLDFGPQVFGGYFGLGGKGYYYNQHFVEPNVSLPAFGYLNYAKGRQNTNAVLDFNREKDGPFITGAPAIPVPVSTEDYFTVTSQAGVQQFRPFYNGEYTVFDRTYSNVSRTTGLGGTFGAGNAFLAGARLDVDNTHAVTRRWDNIYTTAADKDAPDYNEMTGDMSEPVYFKKTGQLTKMDQSYYSLQNKDFTQKVSLHPNQLTNGPNTDAMLIYNNGQLPAQSAQLPVQPIQRTKRDTRTANFSYLTASEASIYGLDRNINGDPSLHRVETPGPGDNFALVHKAHHISEVTVTDEEGKRMVYGVPVYNIDQEEVSFSVDGQPDAHNSWSAARKNGLVNYTPTTPNGPGNNSPGNTSGRLHIYSRKSIPPYTTSFLLSGILSPDYVDKTKDGISDDDLGTAVKFRYKKAATAYRWRAPVQGITDDTKANTANYSEGFLSDTKDDKANYVYGQKELWYLDTIQSKTMVAKFWTHPREDGLGVAGENGVVDNSQRMMKLDSIQLYSRADLASHPNGGAVPIKVVHFEYDYSLYPGVTNNSGADIVVPDPLDPTTTAHINANHGKLTLRKVYFTFGTSSRGKSNPYIFSYDDIHKISEVSGLPANPDPLEQTDYYTQRQTDRWGTYKQSAYNRLVNGSRAVNNSEFPYSLQPSSYETFDTRQLADRLASKWQLNSITTPTGGIVSIEYESDDYSYVQDRQAMEMCPMTSSDGSDNKMTGLVGSNKLYVKVPVAVTDRNAFVQTYLTGSTGQPLSNISFKVYADIDNHDLNYEYVYGYAEIGSVADFDMSMASQNIVGIAVKMVNGYNPVSKATWQLMQNDLPQFAYPNYDNSDVDGLAGSVAAAVRSLMQSFVNFRELGQSFDVTASGKSFANRIDPSKSFIRLNCPIGATTTGNIGKSTTYPTYGKLGGGARVHKVEISDNWVAMGNGSGYKTMAYGVRYDYTMKNDQNRLISSGVAAYEPSIGTEENPFHEPIPYTEKVKWGQDRYHFIEKPFGESYFPAAEVGYSQVKAINYGVDKTAGTPPSENTGYTLSRFYTARDFPTQVDYLPLEERNYENDLTLLLFASQYTMRVSNSQGFKVTLNDMHGKPKFVGVYDNGDALLSSTESYYSVKDDNAQQKQLNNTVLTLDENGNIDANGNLIGTDEELVTDIRESSTSSSGTSIGAYPGGAWFFFFLPFGAVNYNHTSSQRNYNSVSTIKVIHQYGLLKQTKTTKNGSTITADNLCWDGQTGDVLVTRTQNEFDDYTYALHYPAYMAYDGMAGAYRNLGALFAGLTLTNGLIPTEMNIYFAPGDELVDVDDGADIHGWVIPRPGGAAGYHLVDASGNFITTSGDYRLLRSGRRNMLSAGTGTVVTMNNPLVAINGGYMLQAGVDKKVLDAKAVTYKDEWDVPVAKFQTITPQTETDGFLISVGQIKGGGNWLSAQLTALCNGLFSFNPVNQRRYMYSYSGDNVTLQTILQPALDAGTINPNNFFLTCGPGTIQPPPLSQLKYALEIQRSGNYIQPGDKADITYNGLLIGIITFTNFPVFNLFPGDVPFYCSTNSSDCFNSNGFVEQNYVLQGQDCPDVGVTPLITVHYNSVPQTYTLPPLTTCNDPLNQVLNPYYQGVKGDWRVDYDHVYQVNRVQTSVNAGQNGATNIRTSGYYNTYTPFWFLSGRTLNQLPEVPSQVQHTLADPRWEWTSKAIHYDVKGNAVESVDPLKRYSAALYGYQQSVPIAVASNARHNEIAFDGFEDYYFQLQPSGTPDPCPPLRHLDMGFPATQTQGSQICAGDNCIVSDPTNVHSGNYSLNLHSSINISQPGGSANPPGNALGFDGLERYILLSNEQAAGFAPILNKKYLFSVWVKDAAPASNKLSGFQVSINGSNIDLSNKIVPVVDGWKKLDLYFTATDHFTMQLTGSGGVYIDDLRLLPFDGELKTFVYDDQSMRLTGQLDENNFGVFYEYDEEGTPIRVKKETERGVMTVKENRQSYRTYVKPQ